MTKQQEKDTKLAQAAQKELKADPDLGKYDIETSAYLGRVSLNGTVRMFPQKEKAEKIIKAMPGVSEVDNALSVGLPSDK